MNGRTRQAIWWTAAGGLAIVLLQYSLRGIEWHRVGSIMSNAHIARLALSTAVATTTLLLRAYRWRILLNARGKVDNATAFWATAAGYFGNNFLPARAGELIRTYFVSVAARLEYPYVFATAAAERVTDALVLVGVVLTVLLVGEVRPSWVATAARPVGVIAVLAALGIALLPLSGGLLKTLVPRLPLRAAWQRRLATAIDDALSGLRAFHHPWRLTIFAALTVVIWTSDAVSTVIAASALGVHVTIPAAFLLLASLGLSSALPSTPGYVGIYQFVAVTVLAPFGVTRTDAIAYILTAQALNYVVIAVCGSLAFTRYHALQRLARGQTVADSGL